MRHDLQLGHRSGALPQRSAEAVVRGVATADDDDVLALGTDLPGHLALQRLGGLGQVLHRLMDAVQFTAGHREVTRTRRTDRQHHRVEPFEQLLAGDVAADLGGRLEGGAFEHHLLEPPVEDRLLHLEVGDAVTQQTADRVGSLVDDHSVSGAGQLLSHRQSGRSRTDHRDRLQGVPVRHLRGDPAVGPALVDQCDLDVLDGHRIAVDAFHARGFARRRAQPPGELREVVGGVQPLQGVLPFIAPQQVVPFRDEVRQRAAVVAERDAAVHAAARLLDDDRQQCDTGSPGVDLVPVLHSLRHRAPLGDLARSGHESRRISHEQPPS